MRLHFRDIVMRRLRQLKKSKYWLAEEVADSVSQSQVYAFLRGESDMKSSHIERIFEALGLDVIVRERPQEGG